MTTLHQRLIAIGVACALLLSGFAMGRVFDSPQPALAEESKAALVQTQTTQPTDAGENEAFYLKDFKTGYDDGYQLGMTKQSPNVVPTDRVGYNDGFKQGYADAYKLEQPTQALPVAYRNRQQMVYRRDYAPAKRRSSKLKTALTIGAPAAIGAGIGVAAGGKKGAAIGALLGGGGGALYHLFKNKDR